MLYINIPLHVEWMNIFIVIIESKQTFKVKKIHK